MTNRDPDAPYTRPVDAIPFAIDHALRFKIHTSMPGIIVEYDAPTRRAFVRPALRTIYGTGDAPREKPVIINVTVVHPAAGGWNVHMPLQPENAVILLSLIHI